MSPSIIAWHRIARYSPHEDLGTGTLFEPRHPPLVPSLDSPRRPLPSLSCSSLLSVLPSSSSAHTPSVSLLYPLSLAPPVIVSGSSFGSPDTHERPPVSAAYDLTQSGSPNVEVVANIKLSRDLAAAHPQHEAKFRSCSPKREEDLLRAIGSYRKYIATTIKYLETQGPGPEYKNWFGEPNDARVSTVYGVFTKLRIYDLSDYTFDCGCRDPLPHIRGTYIF